MNPEKAWDSAVDLWGLIVALQCCEDTNINDKFAAQGRAAILNVAEKLAQELAAYTDRGGFTPTEAKK